MPQTVRTLCLAIMGHFTPLGFFIIYLTTLRSYGSEEIPSLKIFLDHS